MSDSTSTLSIAAQFHDHWVQSHLPPDIAEFLRQHPNVTPRDIADLLLIDQRLRWRSGRPLRTEDYLQQFPAVAAEHEFRMDLVYGEFRARRECGESPKLSEFVARFPDLEADLRKQTEFAAWFPDLSRSRCSESQTPSEFPRPVPSRIDGYELIKLLGTGGMGDVFLARDTRLDRTVALKMIRSERAGSEIDNRRFENEVQVVAKLEHPHIVSIYDVQLIGPQRYFTMRVMEGGSLSHQRSRFMGDPRQIAQLVAKLADAVHHAHQRGILHRDLKPSNVLLDSAGEPCVTDFGLARVIDQDSDLTGAHDLLGTPEYMAPEQTDSRFGPATVATDVHGLGAILYWLLAGIPPFGRGSVIWETLRLVRETPLRSLRAVKPSVPQDLETICLKALAKEPKQRYGSAQAMGDDLRRFLAGRPIEARPASWLMITSSWARRHPAWASLVATIFAAAGLLFSGMLIHNAQLEDLNSQLSGSLADAKRSESLAQSARRDAELAKTDAELARETAQQSERQTRLTLYAADMLLADKARRSGDALQFGNLLARHAPRVETSANQPAIEDYRGFEWHYLSRFASTPKATLPPIPGRIHCANFSHDGRLLATSGDDGKARLFDTATRNEVALFTTTHRDVRSAVFSPDGSTLATAGDDGAVCLWDIATRTQRWQTRAFAGRAWRLAFAAEGKLLLSIGNEPTVRLWNVADGSSAGELIGHTSLVDSLAVSPNGRIAATGQGYGWVILWDIESRRELSRIESGTATIHAVTFARSQPVLAAGGTDHSTWLWDISNPAEPRRLFRDEHLDEIRSLAFSPNDRLLAIADRSGAVRIWTFETPLAEILRTSGSFGEPMGVSPRTNFQDEPIASRADRPGPNGLRLATINLPAHRGRTESVAFSPDGEQLASGGLDGLVKLWNPDPPSPVRVVFEDPVGQLSEFALSPDGQSFVTVERGHVALRDSQTGKEQRLLTELQEHWRSVTWSADGRFVAASSYEGTLCWWNMQTPDAAPQRVALPDGRKTVRFSPSEPLLAVTQHDPKLLRFFRGGLDQPPQQISLTNCAAIDFSPDGRTFVTNESEDIILGDVVTMTRRHTLLGHLRSIDAVAFHPRGDVVATSGSDRQILIWNVETGTLRHTLTGHRASVQALAFSPDGRSLVSGDSTRVAKVWHVATGQELCELDLPGGPCTRLLFRDDGQELFALTGNRQVVALDISVAK